MGPRKQKREGPGMSELSFVGICRLAWDTSGEKGRQGQGRLGCWCSLPRRQVPPHPLTSHWKPIETLRSLVNPQSKKPGMLQFQWQSGNEAVKHRGCREREVSAQLAAIRVLSVANLWVLLGFSSFFLSLKMHFTHWKYHLFLLSNFL